MKDENKSKRQLIRELAALRQEMVGLKASTPRPVEEVEPGGHDSWRALIEELPDAKRKLAETIRRAGEARFRALAETVAAAIGVYHDGRLLYVNSMAEAVTGYTQDELLAMNLSDLLHPDFRYMATEPIISRRRGEQVIPYTEIEILTKDGAERWLCTAAKAVRFQGKAAVLATAIDVTEQVRTKEALEERLRFESLLSELSAAFINLPAGQVDAEIERWLERIAAFLEVDRVSILEFSEDRTRLQATHTCGLPEIPSPSGAILSDALPWYAARLRRAEVVKQERLPDNLPAEADAERQFCVRYGMRSNLSIPLAAGGSLLGALGISSFRTQRSWPEELVQRLRLAGQVFANALVRKRAEAERERLLAANREQRLRAETLAEVILALTSQTSIEAVLAEILRQVQQLVPFTTANIALLKDDTLHTVRSHGYEAFGSGEAISHLAHPLAALPLALEAIRSLKPIGVPDTRKEPLWTQEEDFAWIRSHIMMPICLHDRALGVLRLDSDRPGQYGAEDAERLQPLVNAIAIALENARLHDQTRQELAERTRAEEELRESEKRYRSVVDNIQDGFYRSDKEGRLIMASPSNARMLGYSSVEEMIGQPLDAFWSNPGERAIGLSSMRQQGISDDREAIFLRKDGSTLPVSISAHFYYDEAGAPLGTEGIIRDITERKRAEAERERLLAAEREQRLQAETLAEVVLALTSHINVEEVLDEIMRQAQRVVPFTTANIALLEGDSFHVVRGYGYEAFGCEDLVAAFRQPLAYFPLDAEAIQARKALVVFDTRSEPCWVSMPGVDWIRSFLMVPICLHERVLGMLGLDSDMPGQFQVEDAERLQPLANAAAAALENARLYDRARQELAERAKMEVEREGLLEAEREQRLRAETLAEVVMALTSQTGIDAVLDEILRQAQRIAPSSAGNIALLEGDKLHTVRWQGYQAFGKTDAISNLVQPLAAFPLAIQAIRSQKPLAVRDAHTEPLWTREEDFTWIRSHIVMPICLRDRLLGVLRLDSDVPGQFCIDDAERLQPLVNTAAVALENARLYEQVRQELAERTWAEGELRQSEARQRALLDAIPDMILRLTREGLVVDLKPPADHVSPGLQPGEGMGAEAHAVAPSKLADWMVSNVRQTLDASGMQNAEFQFPTSQGVRDYEVRFVVSGENEVCTIIRDVTDRKQAEQRVIRAEQMATLGWLAATLAHEINNPLQIIQTHLDLVLDFPLEKGEGEACLRVIRQTISRLSDTTRSVLDFARPQTGLAQPVDVSDVLREVLILTNKRLQQNRIQVATSLQDVPPVLASPGQLAQVFLNLVMNSIEAMSDGGRLRIHVYPEGDQVAVAFTNSGPPIPPEILPRIFEPFISTKPEGTGLGLWVSNNMVSQQGGMLSVRNLSDERGVTCTVKLPASPAPENIQ
jgi:PAS domain S-box-containing protein